MQNCAKNLPEIEREKDIEEGNMERVEEIKIKKKEFKNRLIAKI